MSPIAAKACPACRDAYIAERAGAAAGPPGVYTYAGKMRKSALRRGAPRAANPASQAPQVTLCPRRAFDLAFSLTMSATLARCAARFTARFTSRFTTSFTTSFAASFTARLTARFTAPIAAMLPGVPLHAMESL